MAEKFVDKMKFLVGIEKEEVEEIEEKVSRQSNLNIEKFSTKHNIPSFASKNNMKLVLVEPKNFDESSKIVDNLKGRKPLILNLEKLDGDTARKIFDFVSGAAYALDGNIQKVANGIFIVAPENVEISASEENTIKEDDFNPWKK